MPYRDNSHDWLFFAQSDLHTARLAFQEAIYHMACFHAQQTVEKSLKALLRRYQQPLPKIHSLSKLLHEINQLGIRNFNEKDIVFLDQLYVPTRYPDALLGTLPEGLPSKQDADRAIAAAQNIFDTAKQLIELSKL